MLPVLLRRYCSLRVISFCSNFIPIGHAHTRPRCAHAQRKSSATRPCRSPSLLVASPSQPARLLSRKPFINEHLNMSICIHT
eukprot:6190181-Pleurochrysis_carterae.AAC.6